MGYSQVLGWWLWLLSGLQWVPEQADSRDFPTPQSDTLSWRQWPAPPPRTRVSVLEPHPIAPAAWWLHPYHVHVTSAQGSLLDKKEQGHGIAYDTILVISF